ncbi:Protein phosphatase 1 regulatory subunit pprA [Ananas comosus]|uniref:Protein phosphatase 1 regulatory subunit pprA n=1 Tax=Ananas comosus TaxID=4615 RepID=A0A199UV71_ANACO|nr:Protein phosphatase 1 regulatory subunit pprA [Ananas comosus]
MVRFSCFSAPNHFHKSKAIHQSRGDLHLAPQATSQDQPMKSATGFASSNQKSDENNPSNVCIQQHLSQSSHEDCWKSDDLNSYSCPDDKDFIDVAHLKKSQSLGNILEKERGYNNCDDATEEDDDADRRFSVHYSPDKNIKAVKVSFNVGNSSDDNHHEENYIADSVSITDPLHQESLFSIGRCVDHVDSEQPSSDTGPTIERSHSANSAQSLVPHSRSFENLSSIGGANIDYLNDASFPHDMDGELNLYAKGSFTIVDDRHECNQSNTSGDNYCTGSGGVEFGQNLQFESFAQNLDELNPKEFNIKRIEEWISQIDIENDMIVEEQGESSSSASRRVSQVVAGVSATKHDSRSSLGMELAYNYISTLNAASSSAQMANLGLVAIPILSAFVGLRVLSLSGNSIVRITAGALPKGLHVLNLSKNNISAIEGLRELTRLRLLDLSYNRISRIGHGLASCCSLKELYLAGNKISEVEGLHRLLKLNVLDLRSNKISTSKGLGQLAANYSSLQAINLEGNPAQKNVGDEHLKKYLLSLLPHLEYYNKRPIKAGKEYSDRPSHRMKSSRPLECGGVRLDRKLTQRATIVSPSKLSKSRDVRRPPTGSKPSDHDRMHDRRRLLGVEISNPIRRIRSEGAL